MKSLRRRLYAITVLSVAGLLVVEPLPTTSQLGLSTQRLRLDLSTPFRAIGSIARDVPRVFEIAGEAVGHFVGALFSSPPAHAATTDVTQPATTGPAVPAGATEMVSKRTQDSEVYANPDHTFTALIGHHMHYKDSSGAWQKVDLSFHASGSDQLADHNDVTVRVSSSAVSVTDNATGKGISWPTPAAATVSGQSATYSSGGLSWTYQNTLSGIKLSATVTRSLGAHTYSFPYTLSGQATALTKDAQGNLLSDSFVIPAPIVWGADGIEYTVGAWTLGQGTVSFSFDDTTLPKSAYPYVLDPSTSFYEAVGSDDGNLNCTGLVGIYPPSCTVGVDTTSTHLLPNRTKATSGTYSIYNGLMRFNTSSIPLDAAVASARVLIYPDTMVNANTRYLTADWFASSNWPINASDYNATAQTSASGSPGWALSSFSPLNKYYTLTLSSAGTSVVKGSGAYTGLRFHISGAQPGGVNQLRWYSFENGTSTQPQLSVTYAVAPILNSPAAGAVVYTATPTLQATSSSDAGSIKYNFEILAAGNTTSCSGSVLVSSGFITTNTWAVPAGKLANNTTYYWCAQAQVSTGANTGWSGPQSFLVATQVPGAPTNVTASAASNYSASVSWTAPANSYVAQYTVSASPMGATATTTGATTATLGGLTGCTAYTFTVTASNGLGSSQASAPSNSVMPQGAPAAPTTVIAYARPGGMSVRWNVPPYSCPALTGYSVTPFAGSTAGTSVTVGPNMSAALLTGLTPGTDYTVQVKGTNSVGTGPAGVSNDPVASPVLPAPSSVSSGVQVYVGYADGLRSNPVFPTPWSDSPNVTFEGCTTGCTFDSGAIRVDNPTASALTINNIAVSFAPCASPFAFWPSNISVGPGASVIFAQTVGTPVGGCPEAAGSGNFDTSDVGTTSCSGNDGVVGVISLTINGALFTYRDTGQILNTAGQDVAACGRNESEQWAPIGGATTAGEITGPGSSSMNYCPACQGHYPVNTLDGDFFHSFTDDSIPGRGVPLNLGRTYDSLLAGNDGPFGYGWANSYAMSLSQNPSVGNGVVTLFEESGTTVDFTPTVQGSTTTYVGPSQAIGSLVYNASAQQWTFTRRFHEQFIFDSAGRLISEKDPNNYATTLAYNASGELSTVTDPAGRTLSFTFFPTTGCPIGGSATCWPSGHVKTVQDSGNRTISYAYDSSGNLSSVTDIAGGVTTFPTYDSNHLLKSMMFPNHGTVTNIYNGSGQVTSQSDPSSAPLGKSTTYGYSGTTTTVTDANGNVTKFVYGDGTAQTANTPPGLLYQKVAGSGSSNPATTTYSYDPTTWSVVHSSVIRSGDPNTHDRWTCYNADGDQTALFTGTNAPSSGSACGTNTNQADVASIYQHVADPNTSRVYDLLTSVTSLTADAAHTSEATTYTYGDTQHPWLLTAVARPLQDVFPQQTQTIQYGYSANTADPAPQVGDVTSMTDPNQHASQYGYDAYGDRTKVIDAVGNITTYTFNSLSQLTTMVSPRGNVTGGNPSQFTTSYTPDVLGDPLTVTDPNLHSITYTYESINNVDCGGNPGQLCSASDPEGHATKDTYGLDGQLATATQGAGTSDQAVQSYSYDALGNRLTFTDGNQKVTHYSHADAANPGLVTGVIDPLSRTTTYAYDAVGELVSKTSPSPESLVTSYGYDNAGRLQTLNFSDGMTPNVTYSYWPDGQRKSMADGTGTTSYTYDSLARLTQGTNGTGQVVSYGYDIGSNLTGLTYPNGKTVTRQFDSDERLWKVTDWTTATPSVLTYNPDSLLIGIQYANGVSEAATLDNADAVTGMTDVLASTTLASYAYTRFKNNTLKTDNSQTYGYDNRTELNSVDSSGANYTYDLAGNLRSTPTSSYGYDAADQLCWSASTTASNCTAPPPGATTYAYNLRGDRTSSSGSSTTTFAYDQANRLKIFNPPSGPSTTYAYDGNGLRSSKRVGGTTTQFAWDLTSEALPLLLAESSTNYVYGPRGLPIEQIDSSGNVTSILHDQLGSTRILTNSSGAVVANYTFDPYGRTTAKTGTASTSLQFGGQYTDSETGFQYLRARYYDPFSGQFMTRDPAVGITHTPYGYGINDPLDFVDPSGLVVPYEGGGGWTWTPLTVEEILADPSVLDGMNPPALLAALGGLPDGFKVGPGQSESMGLGPGWRLFCEAYGNITIRWSPGTARTDHMPGPYWRVSSGVSGKSDQIPASEWTDAPPEFAPPPPNDNPPPDACLTSYDALGCGGDPFGDLFGGGGATEEDPIPLDV